ncbi:reduced folate carrier [Ancylostoma caninum]|uniref:Reduced folate carrier n=1 Tax=Ancylostoma caninum TaxID=29170 RepID=A0A368FSD0_ANCCA|nr:reduced folate carrier [Ancylostoma caninum]
MHWKATTVLICVYGILKEFRPATPFLTPYLISGYKNLTLDEVYGQIFPFWTYSYMIFLVPIFFLTDILRYKPIVVLEGACLCCTWALLVWGEGVRQMQLMQICFGLASASEIAYYSYMYAIVDEKNYRRVTSYIRSAALVGKLFAFALAQFLVSTETGSYLLLNQISLAAVCIVFFIALALPRVPSPRVRQEVQEELVREQESQPEQQGLTRGEVERRKLERGIRNYLTTTFKNFQIFKENMVVLKWSAWWALASCGIFQIYNYIQALWLEMQPDPSNVENGLTEFMNTLTGAILAFAIQFAAIDWIKYGELTLTISSCMIAVILAVISQTSHVVLAYVGYVCITSIYHTLITAASCNIAIELTSTNYGLVFGWNTFVAVLLQTLLTLVVADSHGLNLDMRTQFVVYSMYFAAVGALFLVVSIWSRCKKSSTDPIRTDVTQDNE